MVSPISVAQSESGHEHLKRAQIPQQKCPRYPCLHRGHPFCDRSAIVADLCKSHLGALPALRDHPSVNLRLTSLEEGNEMGFTRLKGTMMSGGGGEAVGHLHNSGPPVTNNNFSSALS